jgi:hypothetical protein
MGVSGRLLESVSGSVTYTRVQALWHGIDRHALVRAVPSLGRDDLEWGHDLTTEVSAVVPRTATKVSVAYRLSNLFADMETSEAQPTTSGRFNVELRQQLPYAPLRGGELNILVAARTLLRDLGNEASFYDELLTVSPPLQVTCGIQMRF